MTPKNLFKADKRERHRQTDRQTDRERQADRERGREREKGRWVGGMLALDIE